VSRCEPAADHDFYKVGRVIGSFHVISVAVHGRVATAIVDDAPISDSGNDGFLLREKPRRALARR
jgi:hypothetical protein